MCVSIFNKQDSSVAEGSGCVSSGTVQTGGIRPPDGVKLRERYLPLPSPQSMSGVIQPSPPAIAG